MLCGTSRRCRCVYISSLNWYRTWYKVTNTDALLSLSHPGFLSALGGVCEYRTVQHNSSTQLQCTRCGWQFFVEEAKRQQAEMKSVSKSSWFHSCVSCLKTAADPPPCTRVDQTHPEPCDGAVISTEQAIRRLLIAARTILAYVPVPSLSATPSRKP